VAQAGLASDLNPFCRETVEIGDGWKQRFIYPSRSLAFLILPNPLLILADVFEADPILILADTPIDPGLAEKGARLGWDR